jgi:serine/threonine protein kinase
MASVKAGNSHGAIAIPSWGHAEMFYPAILMERGTETMSPELKTLCSQITEKSGLVSADTLKATASIFRAFLTILRSVHAVGNAHGDVKPENALFMDKQSSQASSPNTTHILRNGSARTLALCDFGHFKQFSLDYNTKFNLKPGTTTSAASKRAKDTVQKIRPEHDDARTAIAVMAAAADDFKPIPGSEGQGGVVPLQIPLRVIHLLTGCAPSVAKAGDPARPPQSVAVSHGTLVYAPPENASRYTKSFEWQPGDI